MALSNWDCIAWDDKGNPCDGTLKYNKRSISIYKTYATAKHKDKILFTVNEGDINSENIHIRACRGPQQAIFLLGTITKGSGMSYKRKHLYAIGCYGFARFGDYYPGVKKSTIRAYFRWLENLYKNNDIWKTDLPKRFRAGKRFCQGDMLFSDDECMSNPGAVEEPIFMTMLGFKNDSNIFKRSWSAIKDFSEYYFDYWSFGYLRYLLIRPIRYFKERRERRKLFKKLRKQAGV